MANKCYNELYFTGDNEQVKQANLFLSDLKIDEWDGAKIEGTDGYFQDLYFSQGCFHFGTRWVPDMVTVKAVADRFGVGFNLNYSDPAMSLYGQARYQNETLNDTRLDIDDFKKINYLKGRDVYEYEGKTYRFLEKPALIVLQQKITQEEQQVRKQRLKPRLG